MLLPSGSDSTAASAICGTLATLTTLKAFEVLLVSKTPASNDRVNRAWRCMWSGRRNSNAMVMRRCIASSRSCGRFVACDKNGELWFSPAVPVPSGQICAPAAQCCLQTAHFVISFREDRRPPDCSQSPGIRCTCLLTMMMMPSCFSTSVSSRLTWCDPRSSLKTGHAPSLRRKAA